MKRQCRTIAACLKLGLEVAGMIKEQGEAGHRQCAHCLAAADPPEYEKRQLRSDVAVFIAVRNYLTITRC
jgi:hypothetical protein